MKSNTKLRLIYCALFCLLAPTSFIFAQSTDEDKMPPPPPPINCPYQGQHMGMQKMKHKTHCDMYPMGHGPKMSFHKHQGQMLKRMQEDLNLTDEQVESIKALHKSMAEKRCAAMESIRAEKDAGMKQILTEEQYKAFTDRCANMKDRKGFKNGCGNQPPRCP